MPDVFDQVAPDTGDVFDQVAPATPSPIQQFESGVGDVARKSVQKPALPSDLTPWPTISPEEKAARAKEMDDALSKMTWKDYVAGAFNVATDPQMGGSQPLSKPGTNIKTHAEQAATPGTRLAGAGGLVGDVGDLASPLLGIGALESPVSTAVGLGTGMAGGKGARAVTKAAGGGEGAQDLAENLGYWIPALTGAVVRPRVGVGVTPEEVVIRGGVNPPGVGPKAGEIRIPRGPKPTPPAPAGTTNEPPTIEGNAQPMTREEAVEHLEANRGTPTVQNPTGWDPDLAKPVPEAPKAPIPDENKVPKAQRASTLIKQDEQAKLAQAMKGRGAAKEALEKGDVFDKVTANEKPASVPQTDQPANSVPAAEGEGTSAASAPSATTGGGGAVPEVVRPAEDVPGQRETPASPSFDTPEFRAHKASEDAYVEQAKKLLPENPSNKDLIAKVMELKKAGGGSPASGPSVAGEKPPQEGQLEGKRPLQVSENGKNDRPANFAETPEKDVFDEVAQYKHRSTQANIPEDSEASQGLGIARSIIAKDDLMGKGRDIGGDHVTVRYGLKADSDVEGVRKYLASQEPFEATLGKTDIFPPSESSDGAAVVHAPIESPDLQRINGEIQKHGDFAESNFKDYKPHATIAYVKPDKSGRYKGMKIVEGKKFKVDTIHITDREGKAEPVKLEGKRDVAVPTAAIGSQPGELERRPAPESDQQSTPYIESAKGDVFDQVGESGARGLAQAVYGKLKAGESLGNVTELNKLAEQHFGSSRVSGKWTPKDAFDAMEAGVNKHLLDRGKDLMKMPVDKGLAELRDLMGKITTQGTRTEEQIKGQQFSTPPTESYVAARVAGITPSDVVLEPSAGNGGLAVWPRSIGAETHVNEISDRRQDMLKFAGFDKPSAHDGEIINSLLDRKVKPTVVLMNPPFSSGILKGDKAKNSNQYGFNHVNSALQRLEDGGRLVAILGGGQANEPNGGAALTTGSSGDWFQGIARDNTVRANVRIHGKEYAKYGTSFATRIIVIDKVKPTETFNPLYGRDKLFENVVTGNVDTLEEAYKLLSGVAESRPAVGGQDVTTRNAGERPATDIQRSGGDREIEASRDSGADKSPRSTGPRVPARGEREDIQKPADRRDEPDRGSGIVQPGKTGERVPVHQPEPPAERPDEARPAEGAGGSSADLDRQRPVREPEVEGLNLSRVTHDQREQEDSSAYVTYRPTIKGPAHPGSIVETKTMSTVPMPEITYRPSLPESILKEGRLSAVQLEAVSIAGQQNDIVLPSGHRASALIGDGTGVGKGREGAAILLDNWNKGRKRLVWVSEKWDLMEDAKRDLNGIGAGELAKGVKAFQKFDAKTPIDHEGVLFTTYALIRSEDKGGNTRVAQLQKWLRGEDEADGSYMLFDESHNLKNAVVGQMGVASEIGQKVRKLLQENPKLRTVSLSATAASDVMNLGYLDRLGLWGPGTAFPSGFEEFAAQISGGGISAMEMVARELKAQGKYVARTLSFKGVTYKELEHKLTPDQKELYRTAVKAWRSVVQDAEETIKKVNNGGPRAVGRFLSLFYGAQLRFFNVLLTTMKLPSVVPDVNKALEDGKSSIITLVNTNEAAQNREKNREQVKAGDEDEPPDYDFGPAEMLVDLVREHYPTQQYSDGVDSNGNKIKIPVVDDAGNPVQNPEAIKRRDKLVEQVKKDLKLPKNPLDILLDSFGGPSKVAELTGRKERFDDATGKFVKRGDEGVKRDQINLSEMRAFQSGKKRIALLSNAAGTGISLHADTNAKNQEKRHQVTLQVGWSADKAMQMLGRSHRANQIHPPEYVTMVTDLGGEKRFSATIAKRLGNLGALSKGQKDATGGSDAMDKVNFESDQGKKAAQTFYKQLLNNREIPGTDGMTGMTVLRDLAVLKKDPQTGVETVPDSDRTNVTRLLNRLLALDPDIQNAVYDYYYDIFTATVNQAIEDGTLDTGVKSLPGDEFSIKEERSISKDPSTGAETYYYPVEAKVKTDRVPVDRARKVLKEYPEAKVMENDKGKLMLVRPAPAIVHADGRTSPAFYTIRPENGVTQKVESWKLQDFEDVNQKSLDAVEKTEQAFQSAKDAVPYAAQTAERYPGQEWAKDNLERAKDRLATAETAMQLARNSGGDPHAAALDKWKEHYDAAPSHETKEHHLIGGAVLRWWNPIREALPNNLDIYTTVDSKTGKRVVGVEIPANAIRKLVDRISGSESTVDDSQLATDVLKNNLNYTLERGIQVRRGAVNRNYVMQLIPPDDSVASNLKRLGVLYEKGISPIYYIPNIGKSPNPEIVKKVLKEYPVQSDKPKPRSSEAGFATVGAINPLEVVKSAKKVYSDFIDKIIREKLDLGDKYRRVAEHDKAIASMLHEKDNAPRYFRDKADSNVTQVTKGLSEDQVRLTAMMADNQIREYLQEEHPDQYDEARNDPAVMKAVQTFKKYQDELAALRIKLGWHVRRDLSSIENEDGTWSVVDQDGDEVDSFKTFKQSQDYVEDNGKLLDHLKRTYPEHMREPLMGATNEPSASGAPYGGIRPPRPDKKQRIASAEYFFQHGAKDFAGYVKSFTQAYHAALNQKIYDSLTGNAELWKEGTALPPQIEYRGKTYYSPDVAKSMKLAKPENRPKVIEEYRAYDPARDDKALIKSFEDGWSTQTTGRPGISPSDRYLAPKDVVDALDHYDMTRGVQEGDSIRRFFQEQIVGLFGPTVHVFNIMRRLANVAGNGVWDPRAWPMLVKLLGSSELRARMAEGLADDAIDSLSKHGTYTNTRDIGSLHDYVLGNMDPRNWARWTIGKFSKGVLFDPKFLGGFGGLDQKARVLALDYLRDEAGMGEEEANRNVEDAFGNYNKANWTERMRRWARALLFPGWDFSSLKWFLRHPIKTAAIPALATMAANLALNKAGKNKDQDKYDFGYLHYGDRKYRSSLFTESMAMHIAQPILEAGKAALEGGSAKDVAVAAGEGAIRGGGGLAGSLRPEIQAAAELLSNRQYLGGNKEITKAEDANYPGKVFPTRKLDKQAAFALVKAFPAISRFLDSSYDNVDVATGFGSVTGVTNYKSGAEERLRANGARAKGYSQTLSILAESDPDAASKFVEDPQKAMYLTFNKDFSELEGALKDIDKQSEQVKLAPGISKSDRDEALKGLEESRKQVLNSADAIADAMQAARLQMKK